MARPEGIKAKLKNNDNKNHRNHEEWQIGKKLGRAKQTWIADLDDDGRELWTGHWERVPELNKEER
jgi:hypothetical protein